jgi:hypothetical protein
MSQVEHGWFRVWIGACVLIFATIAYSVVRDWPTRNKLYSETASSLLDAFRNTADLEVSLTQRRREFERFSDQQIVDRFMAFHHQEADPIARFRYKEGLGPELHGRIGRLLDAFQARASRLSQDRWALVRNRVALLFGLSAAIYAAGWGVVWVRRGFSA